jgi:hypothetical protein
MPIKESSQLANQDTMVPDKKEQQVGSNDELSHKTDPEAYLGGAAAPGGGDQLCGAGPAGASAGE